ncbi:portal protein [Vibrio phage Chloris]|uniref:Portal protein n=1 Tax=Vibrio phage Pontus TaxID=2590874 RepID=A0A4Y6E864_9CAUD|nr:portal protein [Vibrio phage Pontus]QDF14668.1 portal protein [Vibrio phage Pontus]QQO89657.1 portal protein [Vibrio phage GRLPWR]WBU76448.1 portal protein [Vibrio phage Chloris]WBU77026.1 portal protein [Vibrio phage Noelle]
MGFRDWLVTKLNPAQELIAREDPSSTTSNKKPLTTTRAFEDVEVVNRCVNLLVDNACQVRYDIKDQYSFTPLGSGKAKGGIRQDKVKELLNVRPNPFMDASTFWRLVIMDFIMEGWAFVHWDGYSLYHLPAANMEVYADKKQYINRYIYGAQVEFQPNEIIFIKDNAYNRGNSTQIEGFSRILSSLEGLVRREKLLQFKEKFFDNGAVFSLILETEAVLNKKLKKRFEEEISLDYNPRTGRSSVKVLDAGMKAKTLTPTSSKDLDVKADVDDFERKACIALGIPPLLLDSGNNANIRPNVELLFYMTILPMMRKFESVFETFFGYDIKLTTDDITALAPDAKAEAEAVTSKVNNGLITPNEGRIELRYEPLDGQDMDKIRIPQNIAGSGTGVSGQEGGKPSNSDSDDK